MMRGVANRLRQKFRILSHLAISMRSESVAKVSFNAILKGGGPSAAILDRSALARIDSKSRAAKSSMHCSSGPRIVTLHARMACLTGESGESAADAPALSMAAAIKQCMNIHFLNGERISGVSHARPTVTTGPQRERSLK